MIQNVLIIGHPLAAKENWTPFLHQREINFHLIIPEVWNSYSAGHTYLPAAKFGEEINQNCKLYFLKTNFNGRNTFFLWKNLRQHLQQIKPALIYCWAEPWCLSTLQIASFSSKLDIPLIFYSAENKIKNLPWPFTSIQKKVFHKFTACVTPTLEIKSRIVDAGFSKKVFVIPLPIPLRLILPMDQNRKKLVYLGRLIELKQVDLIIKAIPLLAGFTLDIIGDGPELANLKSLADALNLESQVTFLGHIANQQLGDTLANNSLLILPTAENSQQAEQFGKAALEGASFGIPVLTNSTGNLLKLSEKFSTIYSVPLNNPEQMAKAIQVVFNQYPSSEALENTRRQIQEEYGNEKVAALFFEMITSLLTSQSITKQVFA